MKTLLPFLIVLFSFTASGQDEYERLFGDSINEIQWSCSITYLPGGHFENVTLTASRKKVKAEYKTIKWRKRFNRFVKKKIRMSPEEFVRMQNRFRELNQETFSVELSENDKELMREFARDTNYLGERVYKLSPEQLENHLQENYLNVDPSVFEMDSVFQFHGMVIDGAPFKFMQRTVDVHGDTNYRTYSGNLYGGDRYRNLAEYIRFNLLVNTTTAFDRLPLNNYFSRERLVHSLLWYLDGKEGLLEFKPLELKLEE